VILSNSDTVPTSENTSSPATSMQDQDSPGAALNRFRLDGCSAIVTGASSGIGRRFSLVLDAAGARVAIVGRRQDRLEELSRELRNAVPIVADLTEPDAVRNVIDKATDQLGRVDVLVNNAGRSDIGPAQNEQVFRDIVELNLQVPFELARRCASFAIDHSMRLSIINVTSILGLVASRSMPQASYAASKGGLENLTRELANQWAKSRIRVNSIAPGWFVSEMTAEMMESPSGRRYVERHTPMGRHGDSHELDGALLFLASEASSFVTGQVIVVDGGWTIV
jgi:NAD(P)-dependent dehydrogenase (short-subunit alcohol dehydrogenase family)